MYRCGRRHAIDIHTMKNCPRSSCHGHSRGSTTSSVPKPPWKCYTCGQVGHIVRICPSSICYQCGRRSRHASTCRYPVRCHTCDSAHLQAVCPESSEARSRGSDDVLYSYTYKSQRSQSIASYQAISHRRNIDTHRKQPALRRGAIIGHVPLHHVCFVECDRGYR